MQEDYGFEGYAEPSEFDLKINEIINAEVTTRIEQTVKDLEIYKEENDKLGKKLLDAKCKLAKVENDYKKQLEQALIEKELEVHRQLGLGFAVNDIVYYIDNTTTSTKCEKCGGKGNVKVDVLGREAEVRCPHCSYGKILHYNYFPKKDIVRSIKFWMSRKDKYNYNVPGELKEDWDIEIWLDDKDDDIKRKNLYKTLEDCQVACNEKNSKQNTAK